MKLNIEDCSNGQGGRAWIVFGSDFPWYLQTAYGRYIARLMYGERTSKCPQFSLWLRDLPLNVYDLDYAGYCRVVPAFKAEVFRLTPNNPNAV